MLCLKQEQLSYNYIFVKPTQTPIVSSSSVTVRDIARAAGVSAGTVSRALKNQQGMSEETRLRVFEVAARLGYDLENLRVRRLRRVLFLLHKQHQGGHSNLFYSPVLHGAEDACAEAGIALSFASVGLEQNVADLVRTHEADGIICAGFFESEVLQSILQIGLPISLVDHYAPDTVSINDDNFTGAYTLVQHLLQRGYQRIAFISGPVSHYSIRLRERGYRKALFDAGILADPDYTVYYQEGIDQVEASARCMDQLLALPTPPDAVFAFNDLTALVAMNRCQRQGLRIPEDMGLCGYDDIASAAMAHPTLTTVAVEKEALGRDAVHCLIHGAGTQLERMHPVRLVVRESTGGPHIG